MNRGLSRELLGTSNQLIFLLEFHILLLRIYATLHNVVLSSLTSPHVEEVPFGRW